MKRKFILVTMLTLGILFTSCDNSAETPEVAEVNTIEVSEYLTMNEDIDVFIDRAEIVDDSAKIYYSMENRTDQSKGFVLNSATVNGYGIFIDSLSKPTEVLPAGGKKEGYFRIDLDEKDITLLYLKEFGDISFRFGAHDTSGSMSGDKFIDISAIYSSNCYIKVKDVADLKPDPIQVVYDENDIKIFYIGNKKPEYEDDFRPIFYVENNGDSSIKVEIVSATINGEEKDAVFYRTLDPHTRVISDVLFLSTSSQEEAVKETDIVFSIRETIYEENEISSIETITFDAHINEFPLNEFYEEEESEK